MWCVCFGWASIESKGKLLGIFEENFSLSTRQINQHTQSCNRHTSSTSSSSSKNDDEKEEEAKRSSSSEKAAINQQKQVKVANPRTERLKENSNEIKTKQQQQQQQKTRSEKENQISWCIHAKRRSFPSGCVTVSTVSIDKI